MTRTAISPRFAIRTRRSGSGIHIAAHGWLQSAGRAETMDHNPRAAKRLPGDLLVERVAEPDADKPPPSFGAVDLRAVNGVDAECHHITGFGGAFYSVLQAIPRGWQVRRAGSTVGHCDDVVK